MKYEFKQDLMITIAKNIRKYRKLKGFTQRELARIIGVNEDFYRRFETFKEGLSLKNIYKISVVLDVRIDKFLE